MGFCSQVKTAIFGGSFNPVHCGHLALAEEVKKLGYEKILFVPASTPPHKSLAVGAEDVDRVEMLKIALSNSPWAEIWEGELQRVGPSYTIDTVRELQKTGFLESPPGLIIGDDLAEGFLTWKYAEELAENVVIILARRSPNNSVDFPLSCIRMQNELWPHSSTEVRFLIRNGKDLGGIVPESVAAYIRRNSLYGYASA